MIKSLSKAIVINFNPCHVNIVLQIFTAGKNPIIIPGAFIKEDL
jgi:hypothetical protein